MIYDRDGDAYAYFLRAQMCYQERQRARQWDRGKPAPSREQIYLNYKRYM